MQQRLRILVYTENFGTPTTTFIYNEVIELAKWHDVKVICLNRRGEDKFPFDNVEILLYKEWRIIRAIKWRLLKYNLFMNFYNPLFKKQVAQIFKDFNPDIVHGHFGNESLRLIDNLPAGFNIPFFITFHGYDASTDLEKFPIYRKKLNKVFKLPLFFPLFVSNFMYDDVQTMYQLEPGEKRILYCGVNLSTFGRTRYHENRMKVFLQVSGFSSEKKGHYYTLLAFQKFLTDNPTQKCKLILAGGGLLLEKIKSFSEGLNLSDSIHFTGWVSPEEAKTLMEEANFFVHHSITNAERDLEGIPTAIMEAMAMELPVISTYHAGIPELVEDGINGYLVQEKNIDDYAQKLKDILNWGYKKENREKIEKYFDLDKHYQTQINFYYSVLNSQSVLS